MINLDRWGKDLEKLIAQADSFQRKELSKKEREYEEARKRVDAEFHAQKQLVNKEAEHAKTQIEQAALNKAAFMLYQDLQASYQALQQATVPPVLTEAEQARVQPFIEQLKANKENEAVRTALATVAQSMFSAEPALIKALDFGVSGKKEFPQITTYIGFEKGVCYVIAPVDGEQNKELASDLETRLLDVAGRNQFEIQRTGVFNREHQVEGIAKDIIACTPETELVNKFLWYTLTLPEKEQARSPILQQAVIDKYNELQASHPLASFAQLGITHNLVPLDGRVLAFFKAHSVKEINRPEYSVQGLREQGVTEVSHEQAASILGYSLPYCKALIREGKLGSTPEGNVPLSALETYTLQNKHIEGIRGEERSSLNFRGATPEERRQEALERLERYGDKVTYAEAADIMGGMAHPSVQGIAVQIEGTERYGGGAGKKNMIPKEGLRAYIRTHIPHKKMWRKPGASSDVH